MFSPLTDASFLPISATYFISNPCYLCAYLFHPLLIPYNLAATPPLQRNHSDGRILPSSMYNFLSSFWVLAAFSAAIFSKSSLVWLFTPLCLLLRWQFSNFHGLLSRLALYVFCFSRSAWMSTIPHTRVHVVDRILPPNSLLFLKCLSHLPSNHLRKGPGSRSSLCWLIHSPQLNRDHVA